MVEDDDAISMTNRLAKEEGILVGISAGANVFVASEFAKKEEHKDKNIVTFLCDSGERYLSTGIFE
jgi:cysteine synthase A